MADSVESSDDGDSLQNDALSIYEQQNISMFRLIKTLLSTSTMPHIILIILLSVILYITARVDSLNVSVAMAFTSLSASYAMTALLANNKTISNWITLDENNTNDEMSILIRNLYSFRICLFPLVTSVGIFVLLSLTTGENGVVANANNAIPLILGMMFIAWSIVQGTSFSQWASNNSAKKITNAKNLASLKTSTIIAAAVIFLAGMILASMFYQFQNFDNSLLQSILHSIPFSFVALGLFLGSLSYSWKFKKLSSMKPRLQKFSTRWSLICHLFIAWHLLTIWRQNFMDPSIIQVFVEEIALMIFTVFVAIWSMTSRGYRSKFKLITEKNALAWGLAFGYAYAGSVAMLTTFFDDIKIVMSIGHAVVIVTVIYVHKIVLQNIIEKDNTSVDVSRILQDSELSTDTEDTEIDIIQAKIESNSAKQQDSQEVWQEDNNVDWDKEQEQVQIDNIEWDETIDLD